MHFARIGLAVLQQQGSSSLQRVRERDYRAGFESDLWSRKLLRWSHCGRTIKGMRSVVKRSVSLPSELFEALESQATAEGRTVSAALTDAADLWLSTRRGLKAVRAWERQHGALTASELAEADRILDAAGVGRS